MRFLGITIFLFSSWKASCQRPKSGAWLSLQLPVSISQKWQWHNDAGYRTLGNRTAASQFLYRTGLRYKISEQWNTAGGIAFFFTRSSFEKKNHEFGKEFRIWQEVNYKCIIANHIQWQNRIRTEQRFYAATNNRAAFTAYRFRLKSQLQQSISKKWSLQLANEYMQQLTHSKLAFDQNRLIIAGVFQPDNSTQLQAGYMWLRWPAHSSQHIFTVTVQKNISFHGK